MGGSRVRKTEPIVAALGDIDETNASIGIAVGHCGFEDLRASLLEIQSRLFDIGAAIAGSPIGKVDDWIRDLEAQIDTLQQELQPLRAFILPGGSDLGAALHLSRTVCRRAERSVAAIERVDALRYLNRLSDLLFVMARTANSRSGVQETIWRKEEG